MTSERRLRPAWMYRQSAALPYRWRGNELEVLLITSRERKRWIVPKGIVEPGLTPARSAEKEALEEAGVAEDIDKDAIGSYRHSKWGGVCDIEVFLLQVSSELDDWEEAAVRNRRWLSVSEAVRHVDNEELAILIARLPDVAMLIDRHTA